MTVNETGGADGARLRPATLWALVLALWATQVWRPQISYPETGFMEVVTWIVLLVAAPLSIPAGPAGRRPRAARFACVAGCAFVSWYIARWAWAGFPATGAVNAGTILGAAAAATIAAILGTAAHAAAARDGDADGASRPDWMLAGTVAVVALACSLHALVQYLWLYDRALAQVLEDVGTAEPTPLQMGLIHHFRIRRVASVWGDPNNLGGFLAMSVPASLALALRFVRARRQAGTGAGGWILPMGLVGVVALPLALVAIALTGSRGAVLDLAVAAAAYASLRLWRCRNGAGVALLAALLLAAAQAPPAAMHDAGAAQPAVQSQTSMLERSNTIRERLHYMRIGAAITARNPVAGSGPGSVDVYYGRYKPPEARESKYLHNWILQTAAETGVVGVMLACAFVGLLAAAAAGRMREPRGPGAALPVMAAVFVCDALYQNSFNQREMMVTFGLVAGLLLSGSVDGTAAGRTRGYVARAIGWLMAVALATLVFPWLIAASYRQSADDAHAGGDAAAARSALAAAARWTPRDAGIPMRLAYIARSLGDKTGAIAHLQRAVALQPESASLRAQLARLMMDMPDLEAAEREIRKAIELYPSKDEYRYDCARILERKGDLEGAKREARRAVDLAYYYPERYRDYLQGLERK